MSVRHGRESWHAARTLFRPCHERRRPAFECPCASETLSAVERGNDVGCLRRMRLHVGCSGWFYSHWRGIFYPRQEPTTKQWFAYYANVFRTVELNAPFYR